MSKVLVIPDSHTKINVIEEGLEMADYLHADYIVMLGDYFDDFGATLKQQEEMLAYLKDILRKRTNIIPLFGNHELSYLGYKCSGFMPSAEPMIKKGLKHDYRFVFAAGIDGVLYTHAGVTQQWVREHKILTENAIRYRLGPENGASQIEEKINGAEDLSVFYEVGYCRGGNTSAPSPLWADYKELINDPLPITKQVVGHTPIKNIECINNCWFCDVRSNGNQCDEFLLVKDGEPIIYKYGDMMDAKDRGK